MNSKKPVITLFGGAGYLGGPLSRLLIDAGYYVRVYDNMLFGKAATQNLDPESADIIKADICDVKSISEACVGADIVIMLASIVGRRSTDPTRKTTRDINLLASSVVVDAAIEHGVGRLIFASSDSIYGNANGVVYETATPEPTNLYARLKLRMEERIINAKRRDFHPTVLRIGSCYGYSPRMRFDLTANNLVLEAFNHKKITVPSAEDCRAFIHVEDTAKAFIQCLLAHENLISGEVFNVCDSSQNLTLREVANTISQYIPGTEIVVEDEEPQLNDYKLSASKIEKVLDFVPSWTLEEGIDQIKGMLLEGKFEDPYSLQYNNT